ncbi:hypothetical protein ACMD2_01544 [Ananas comosus]|uniref:Uncharacterized protein n=1 Tax=Ananas comosus TaxID=4615 RepID=A0A199W1J2_ANACO|nr:hypothetical protein ACMD2_01544 [Ananas comosus]
MRGGIGSDLRHEDGVLEVHLGGRAREELLFRDHEGALELVHAVEGAIGLGLHEPDPLAGALDLGDTGDALDDPPGDGEVGDEGAGEALSDRGGGAGAAAGEDLDEVDGDAHGGVGGGASRPGGLGHRGAHGDRSFWGRGIWDLGMEMEMGD